MIRRPPRSTQSRSSAASDVYKRQELFFAGINSLKDKRMYLRSIKQRLQRRHGATVAEVGFQDLWRRSRLVLAIAASSPTVLEQDLQRAREALDSGDWELISLEEEVVEVDG